MNELWTPWTGLQPVQGANLPILMFDPSQDKHVPRGPYNVDSESRVADKLLHGSWFIHPWELTPDKAEQQAFIDRIGRECQQRGVQLRPSPQSEQRLTLVFGVVLGLDTVTVPTPEHLGGSIELVKQYRRTQKPIPNDSELPHA